MYEDTLTMSPGLPPSAPATSAAAEQERDEDGRKALPSPLVTLPYCMDNALTRTASGSEARSPDSVSSAAIDSGSSVESATHIACAEAARHTLHHAPQMPSVRPAPVRPPPSAATPAPSTTPAAAVTAPRYELLRRLGQGAMATVWLARDRVEGTHVALKVVTKERHFAAAKSEYALGCALSHPHLVPSLRCLQTPHTVVIVQEWANGGELFGHIVHGVGADEGVARGAMADVLDALEYLHANGITHRDVKPENIFLDSERGALLGDFGSAELSGTVARCGPGTLPYLPPEAADGKRYVVDGSLDAWGFGICLFVLLAGDFPWLKPRCSDPDFAAFANGHRTHAAWSTFSRPMCQLLNALLDLDPAKRPSPAEIWPFFRLPWFTPAITAERRRYFQQADDDQQRQLALAQQELLLHEQHRHETAMATSAAAAAAAAQAVASVTRIQPLQQPPLVTPCGQSQCANTQHQHSHRPQHTHHHHTRQQQHAHLASHGKVQAQRHQAAHAASIPRPSTAYVRLMRGGANASCLTPAMHARQQLLSRSRSTGAYALV